MTVALTGATGFIGSKLLKRLQDLGYRVLAFSRFGQSCVSGDNVDWIPSDMDVSSIAESFEVNNVKGVVHLASVFVKDHSSEQIDELVNANILFGTRVLEAAAKANCKWFVNTGTAWQHHSSRRFRPANLYAATKQAFENIAKYYSIAYSMKIATIKLGDTYGPGDTRRKIFNLWKDAVLSGKVLAMSGGKQKLRFLHVDDVVEAFLAVVRWIDEMSKPGLASFAAIGREELSLRRAAQLFEEVSQKKIPIQWGVLPYRPNEVMKPWKPLGGIPGWMPKVKLRDGIRQMLDEEGWYSGGLSGPDRRTT